MKIILLSLFMTVLIIVVFVALVFDPDEKYWSIDK
jgi:hypothetical protein